MSDDVDQFYADHVARGPNHVVLVTVILPDGTIGRVEVFSTLAKAQEWSDTLPDDTYSHCVHSPHIIDVPEYGNVPKGERN